MDARMDSQNSATCLLNARIRAPHPRKRETKARLQSYGKLANLGEPRGRPTGLLLLVSVHVALSVLSPTADARRTS